MKWKLKSQQLLGPTWGDSWPFTSLNFSLITSSTYVFNTTLMRYIIILKLWTERCNIAFARWQPTNLCLSRAMSSNSFCCQWRPSALQMAGESAPLPHGRGMHPPPCPSWRPSRLSHKLQTPTGPAEPGTAVDWAESHLREKTDPPGVNWIAHQSIACTQTVLDVFLLRYMLHQGSTSLITWFTRRAYFHTPHEKICQSIDSGLFIAQLDSLMSSKSASIAKLFLIANTPLDGLLYW